MRYNKLLAVRGEKMKKTAYLLMVLIAAITSRAFSEEPVHFADANLKAAVEARLGILDPTPTDMLALGFLGANFSGIADLTGIEYATNLTRLILDHNPISDISALSGLMDLWYVELTGK